MNHTQNILNKIANNTEVAGIIGPGYVGLPLAVEFAKKIPVVSFDINQTRKLNNNNDNPTTMITMITRQQ